MTSGIQTMTDDIYVQAYPGGDLSATSRVAPACPQIENIFLSGQEPA